MSDLRIMMCGSADAERLTETFDRIVREMGCRPINYFDPSTFEFDDYGTSENNSRKAVTISDILVYIISDKIGHITWNVEFVEARRQGKPFILLCYKDILTVFYKTRNDYVFPKLEAKYSDRDKVTQLIMTLDNQGLIAIPYDYNSFGETLKGQIVRQFSSGVKALREGNKKQDLVNLIINNDFNALKNKLLRDEERTRLKEILNDIFQNKELRKRIIDFFIVHKGLSDDEIIDLITDTEQGIARKAIANLHRLVNKDSDIERIFDALVAAAEDDTDYGTERRAIKAMFEIDTLKAAEYLQKFFPAGDIGTPRRILEWLNDNFKVIEQYSTADYKKSSIQSIIDKSREFKKDKTLSDLYESLMGKINIYLDKE